VSFAYAAGDPAAPYRPRIPIHVKGAILYNAQLDAKGLAGPVREDQGLSTR
jgi:hypothetical protein